VNGALVIDRLATGTTTRKDSPGNKLVTGQPANMQAEDFENVLRDFMRLRWQQPGWTALGAIHAANLSPGSPPPATYW